jgi:hypothetical protein
MAVRRPRRCVLRASAESLSGTTMGAVGLLGAMESLDAEGADAYPRKRRRGDLSPTSQI